MAVAQSLNLNLPSSPRTFQSDRIRSGDLDCSMSIGSATNVEFGVVGILNENGPYDSYGLNGLPPGYDNNDFVRDVGVYGRITIPIGAPKERINCNRLYVLELERRELELQKLRQEIANLRNLSFEN
jgi:hypothetical protein